MKGKYGIAIALNAAIICAVVISGGTTAYLMCKDSALNIFPVGSQVSAIDESWDPPETMTAGKKYTKKVCVKNTGTVDCYVRVFAEPEDAGMSNSVSIDWNTDNWTEKQSDGYYYYKSVLSPGEKTKPLFTTISATKDLKEFDMIVYEETVQAAGSQSPQEAF